MYILIKFKFNPYDTAEDVYKEMNDKITEYQNAKDDMDGFDKIARFLTHIPTFVYKILRTKIKYNSTTFLFF